MPVRRKRSHFIFEGYVLLPVPCDFIAKASFCNRISKKCERSEHGLVFSNSSNEKHYLQTILGKLLNHSGYIFIISRTQKYHYTKTFELLFEFPKLLRLHSNQIDVGT